MRLSRKGNGKNAAKLSARNQLKGKVVEIRRGVTTAHVRIRLGGGALITASIRNQAIEDPAPANGGNTAQRSRWPSQIFE